MATSAANAHGQYTGAVLSYTGLGAGSSCSAGSGACLTGVSLVRGTGDLLDGGFVQQMEPYEVTAVSGYAPDYKLTITPSITSDLTPNATVYDDGTCNLFDTSAALPSGPVAPDGISYYDRCIWGNRDITISGDTFVLNPTAIDGAPQIWRRIFSNALMSTSSFTIPITDAWNGVPTSNSGEPAWDDTWSDNTYRTSNGGSFSWFAYDYGTCYAPSGYSYTPDFAQWQSEWPRPRVHGGQLNAAHR